jgi:hypothetical protein
MAYVITLQVYIVWPECMLSVLPRMEDQLQVDVEETRTKACELIGRLLLIPGLIHSTGTAHVVIQRVPLRP